MVEIITENWMLQGWHQAHSGNWYHPNVCRGASAHLPENCDECGRLFLDRKYKAKGKKGGSGKHYCSRSCAKTSAIRSQDLSHLKAFDIRPGTTPYNFIGRTRHNHGYIVVAKGNQVKLEHRLVVEKHIGRSLRSNEIVHHKNVDKID